MTRHGVKKTLRSDSTAIINSLLQSPQVMCSEKLSDEEQIESGLFQVIDGPFKISYGACMMATGVLMAPVPGLVAKVKTREIYDANGARAEITGVSFKFRKPKSPFHYERDSIQYESSGMNTVTHSKGYSIRFTIALLGDPHKHEILPEKINNEHVVIDAKTTVTGYGLFTTGVGRILAGAWDPVWGIPKAGCYAIKCCR